MSCPYASADYKIVKTSTPNMNIGSGCPFHSHQQPETDIPSSAKIDVNVRGGTHRTSEGQAILLADIGGADRIREACTRFYAHAFLDSNLQQFFFEEDGAEAHGKRLADWIVEKMDANQKPWTESGRYGQRLYF